MVRTGCQRTSSRSPVVFKHKARVDPWNRGEPRALDPADLDNCGSLPQQSSHWGPRTHVRVLPLSTSPPSPPDPVLYPLTSLPTWTPSNSDTSPTSSLHDWETGGSPVSPPVRVRVRPVKCIRRWRGESFGTRGVVHGRPVSRWPRLPRLDTVSGSCVETDGSSLSCSAQCAPH